MIDVGRIPSLGEFLRDALTQWKSNIALIEVDRHRVSAELRYSEVSERSLAFARALELVGVGPGDRVAILMSNQSRWLIAAYAVFYRGATLVPLDYKLTAPEQHALLAHAKPKALVIEAPLFARFDTRPTIPHVFLTDTGPRTDRGGATDFDEARGDGRAPTFERQTREDIATIVYSSGTGGRPKGCMLTHDAYLEQYRALMQLFPMQVGERYFSVLPTNHAIDFMCGFLGPFGCGATVVHQRTLRPEFLLSTMKTQRITHMALVPLILAAFERAIREKLDAEPEWKRRLVDGLAAVNESMTRRAPNHRLSKTLLKPIHDAFGGHLRLLFCGGAFVDRARAEFFYRLGFPVVIGYGLTEACTVATVNDLAPFRADSVGRAVDGVEVKLVDVDAQGVGEVWLRGRTLMRGYLEDPELTAETLTPDGWLRTGDRGSLDAAHHLKLVGRAKNMIVTAGGKNVYPEDVEAAFEGAGCDELAVFSSSYVWPNVTMTDEGLVAVVRARRDAVDALAEELRRRNRRLPDYKRIHAMLVVDDAFPRTASMKLKRHELALALRANDERPALVPLE